jgi:hypothetical protein
MSWEQGRGRVAPAPAGDLTPDAFRADSSVWSIDDITAFRALYPDQARLLDFRLDE